MADQYDVIVIGAGLGGLTAAALIARAGRKTLLVERNELVGGAASTYRFGDLVVEASLHETSDPLDPLDPKHAILARIGVLDAVEWVPTGLIYEFGEDRWANHLSCPTVFQRPALPWPSASSLPGRALRQCLVTWNASRLASGC